MKVFVLRFEGTYNSCLASVGYYVILTLEYLERMDKVLDNKDRETLINSTDFLNRIQYFFGDDYRHFPVLNQIFLIVDKWKREDKNRMKPSFFSLNQLKVVLRSTFFSPDQTSRLRDSFYSTVKSGMDEFGLDDPSEFLKPTFAKGALVVATKPEYFTECRVAVMNMLKYRKNGPFFF